MTEGKGVAREWTVDVLSGGDSLYREGVKISPGFVPVVASSHHRTCCYFARPRCAPRVARSEAVYRPRATVRRSAKLRAPWRTSRREVATRLTPVRRRQRVSEFLVFQRDDVACPRLSMICTNILDDTSKCYSTSSRTGGCSSSMAVVKV